MYSGVMGASAPPATTMSASPERISSRPRPIALAPAAQAVHGAMQGPLAPMSIATCPAAMFSRPMGRVMGETSEGPSSISTRCCSSSVAVPPAPEPRMTATRELSAHAPGVSPACAKASRTATTANWE